MCGLILFELVTYVDTDLESEFLEKSTKYWYSCIVNTYTSGVGTVAAVAALVATLFRP